MQVKEIHITLAKPGMMVAEDVYTDGNDLILPCNSVLDADVIRQLRKWEIYRLCVYEPDEELQETAMENSAEERDNVLHTEEIRKSKEFVVFKQEFEETVHGLKKTFQRMLDNSENDGVDVITAQVESILKSGHGTLHILDMLNCMREYDDVTFAHCISVAVLSHLIGEWMHYPEEDLNVLSLCGALHDIGKLRIDSAIISKPGKLTKEEYRKVQEHPKLGFEILKDRDLDVRVKYAALCHHERGDGTGYPMGLAGDKIQKFSKIVAIADVYDAMTADRSYRKGMCPFQALEIIEQDGFSKYDPQIMMTFMEKIVQSYINASVLLSDGRIGEIVGINQNAIIRPLVRIDDLFVDLAKEKDLTIEKIL